MDLLTGYGSDASDSEDGCVPLTESNSDAAGKQSVLHRATPLLSQSRPERAQQHQKPQGAQSGADLSKQNDVSDVPEGTADVSLGLAQLPRPATVTFLNPSTRGHSMISPALGNDGRDGVRKIVSMQLPFRKELLAATLDSDDEDEPVAKRVRTTGAKSRLMDFLPPPKYDTGTVRPLESVSREPTPLAGSATTAGVRAGAAASTAGNAAGMAAGGCGTAGGNTTTLPTDFFSDFTQATYSNQAYYVADDDLPEGGQRAYTGPSVETHPDGTYYDSSCSDPSAYFTHDYGPAAGPSRAAGAASRAGIVAAASAAKDLIAEALRAEQERANKRGGSDAGPVKLVEINATDLTRMDPAAREAANSARDALGPEYALSLRRSATPFEGSKMARRKHQIGTLLFNARMQELDQMEKRTQGQKSKAETAAKYGW
ncbi:hypothetical protein VaNZ11_003899 [Volvox africanus]|uniref:Proline-rich protein PRCC n=1 Tax=Volvox africanus TaxID=51714 RepID=A0ABQ5RWB6_9CHLO|nr:hypothetical protein VaNZ11_003899 [Volvox africanus]